MAYKFNPFLGNLDYYDKATTVAATAPSSPYNGMFWLSTVDKTLYVYYYNSWWAVRYFPIVAQDLTGTPMPFGGMLHLTYPM